MKLFLIFLFIFFISFILGYITACILYTAKQADKEENIQFRSFSETYEQKKIKELQQELKETQLKASYYIQIINNIEKEFKNQQFNSVINLINKIKSIISPENNSEIEKRKELTKTATNEND